MVFTAQKWLIDLAIQRIGADLEAALCAKDLIVLSRLVDLVASLKDENPRAELGEEATRVKVVKKFNSSNHRGGEARGKAAKAVAVETQSWGFGRRLFPS